MFIVEKYVKIRFRNRIPPCYFLEFKRWKILQNLNKWDCFYNILSLIYYGFSRAKTDLQSKCTFKFVFGIFFEQGHLLDSFILGVYAQRWAKFTYFKTETEDHSIGRKFSEKKMWGYGVSFWKKRKLCMQNLTKERKQPPRVILQ